jgi:hypothetical protein
MRPLGEYGYPTRAHVPPRRFPVTRVKKNSQLDEDISQTFPGKAWILSITGRGN